MNNELRIGYMATVKGCPRSRLILRYYQGSELRKQDPMSSLVGGDVNYILSCDGTTMGHYGLTATQFLWDYYL